MGNNSTKNRNDPVPIYQSPSEEEINKIDKEISDLQKRAIDEKLTLDVINRISFLRNDLMIKQENHQKKLITYKCLQCIDKNRQRIRKMITEVMSHSKNGHIVSTNILPWNGFFVNDFDIILKFNASEMGELYRLLTEDEEFKKFQPKYDNKSCYIVFSFYDIQRLSSNEKLIF